MKRTWTPIMVAVMAVALAGCSTGPGGASNSGPRVSESLDQLGPTTASTPSAPSQMTPSAASPESTPTSQTHGVDADAVVIGQWGGATEGSPVLWFAPEGRFNGNDGCNTLGGTWVGSGQEFELREMTMTLIGCLGMDTWLSGAASVTVDGQTLRVSDTDGVEIGTLPRLNVAD